MTLWIVKRKKKSESKTVLRVEHCLAACEVISKPLRFAGQEKADLVKRTDILKF